MSDNPVNKKAEDTAKTQVKAGEVDTTSPLAKMLHAQNETHTRFLDSIQKPAAPHPSNEIAAAPHLTLPAVHLIEKSVAQTASTQAPQISYFQSAINGISDLRGTLKSAKEAVSDFSSKHSTTEKLMLAGGLLVGAATSLVPELRPFRGEAKVGAAKVTEELALGSKTAAQVGLDSVKAAKDARAAKDLERPLNTVVTGEKAPIKPATVEVAKPTVTPVAQPERKILSNGTPLRSEAEPNAANFLTEQHLGTQGEFHVETSAAPTFKLTKAPEIYPAVVDAHVRTNNVPATDVHVRPAAHEDLSAAPTARVREPDAVKIEPIKPVKTAKAAAPAPAEAQVLRERPAAHVDETGKAPAAAPAPAESQVLRDKPTAHVEPKIEAPATVTAKAQQAERSGLSGQTNEVVSPVIVAPHPSAIEAGTKELVVREPKAEALVVRPDTTHSTGALRTESTIAETQIVSHSNALAENVHRLELPANAAPEVVAAKARLQEGSLLLSQSPEKVKVLQNMQADLKVLEKSVPTEALADIRKNVAAMQAPAETMERSALGAAEKQAVHISPTESASLPPSDAQAASRNAIEPRNEIRSTANVEKPAVTSSKPAQTSVPSVNAVTSQAPHAASVQQQSLKLLESSELSKPGREAASKIIQDTNDWGAKTLSQRSEVVERLEKNLNTLSAEAGTGKEISAMAKSVETLKLGTRAESAAVKADVEIGSLTSRVSPKIAENAEFKAAQTRLTENTASFGTVRSKTSAAELHSDLDMMERVAGKEAVAPVRQRITDLEKAVVERDAALPVASEKPAFSTSPLSEVQATSRPSASEAMRSEAALESHAPGVVSKQELNAASEQLRGTTNKLQEDTLAVLERGGLKSVSRKALVDVVQDSGNVARLEGPARAKALGRIEENLKIAAQDERIAAEAGSLRKTLDSVETTSAKAERLEHFDRTSAETLPKINEAVADIRKSHFANPETAQKAGMQLKAIEDDAVSLAKTSDKGPALARMQANVDRLEESLGKEAVAPLKENVDRLEFSHRNSARAHAVEETAVKAQASREGLSTEMRDLTQADAKLSPAAKSAAQDVEKLTAGNQRLSDAEVTRLRDNVATVSKDAEPAVAARLHGHIHNIETGHDLAKLDKTLASVSEDTVAANRQAALAASKNPESSVVALHQATESLRLNGVAELPAARVAYEKALPALSREDAINIDRSLSRIETHTSEVSALKQKLADMQNAHVANVEQNPHLYSQNESQRAKDIHQLVTSHRDGAVAEALERTASVRNTSELSVFTKPANQEVRTDNVVAFTRPLNRLLSIEQSARDITAAAREGVIGLRRNPIAAGVAGTIGVGTVAFMPTLAAAQAPAYNARQSNFDPHDFSLKSQLVLNASPSDTTTVRASAVTTAPASLDHALQQQAAKVEAAVNKTETGVKSEANVRADATVKPEVAGRPDASVKTESAAKSEAPAVKADPIVRGALTADFASLSPTMQVLLRTPEGGFDPTNGQRMKFGNTLIWNLAQSGAQQAPESAKVATIYSKVFKASTVTVGQTDSTDDRSRIFYPPFISPLAVSARVRRPQSLLGVEPVRVGNSTGFLTANLSPNTTSLSNPLNFTREKADGGTEDRGNTGAGPISNGLNLAAASASTSTALLNAAAVDPNGQAVSQTVTSES